MPWLLALGLTAPCSSQHWVEPGETQGVAPNLPSLPWIPFFTNWKHGKQLT